MSIKLFKVYINLCNELKVCPTWEGLNKFKGAFK